MKPKDIRDLVWFSEDEARTDTLFESDQLWSQVVCLQQSQGIGPMSDAGSDAFVTVLAGQVSAQAGKGRTRLGQWESILVPAGTDLTLRNASEEPSVVLLVLAPPPASSI